MFKIKKEEQITELYKPQQIEIKLESQPENKLKEQKNENQNLININQKLSNKIKDSEKNYNEKNNDTNIDENKNTINDNDQSELNKITPKNLNDFKEEDEFIKVNKPEKEKNHLIQSLNLSNNKIKINSEKKEYEHTNKIKKQKKSKKKYISNKYPTNQTEIEIKIKQLRKILILVRKSARRR